VTIIHGVKFTNMSRELFKFHRKKKQSNQSGTGPTDLGIIILAAAEKLY